LRSSLGGLVANVPPGAFATPSVHSSLTVQSGDSPAQVRRAQASRNSVSNARANALQNGRSCDLVLSLARLLTIGEVENNRVFARGQFRGHSGAIGFGNALPLFFPVIVKPVSERDVTQRGLLQNGVRRGRGANAKNTRCANGTLGGATGSMEMRGGASAITSSVFFLFYSSFQPAAPSLRSGPGGRTARAKVG